MITAKEQVRAVMKKLPDDCSMDDLLYQLYVSDRIERGLQDIAEGRVMSQATAEERYRKWKAGKSRGPNRRSKTSKTLTRISP